MKRTILVITALSSVLVLNAQLNESDTLNLQFRASLTGNIQRGNVRVTTIKSKLDVVYAPGTGWVFKTQNNTLYQAFAAKADNDLFSRDYVYFKPTKTVYPYAIAFISANYRRKIANRVFAGAGVTWQILNQRRNVLKLSANTVYESTKFNGSKFNYTAFNGETTSRKWRGSLFISGFHSLFDKHLRLYYDAYWQPSFTEVVDYRIEYEIGLECPVWKGLTINGLYNIKYENLVVAGIKQDDSMLTFGIAYTLKRQSK
jgi:Protein of unknown function, DUF481